MQKIYLFATEGATHDRGHPRPSSASASSSPAKRAKTGNLGGWDTQQDAAMETEADADEEEEEEQRAAESQEEDADASDRADQGQGSTSKPFKSGLSSKSVRRLGTKLAVPKHNLESVDYMQCHWRVR